jgi:hypothetical protein
MLALTVAWERRLARRNGEPLLDLPLFRDRTFSAGLVVNFGLVFFFGSFMFVLTLLLQAGLGQPPLHAGQAASDRVAVADPVREQVTAAVESASADVAG